MDMTLYALLMRKLQDQKECLTWNGNRVEVVDAIPESPQPNTIYFVKSDILATTKIPTESVTPDDSEDNGEAIAHMSMDTDVVELEPVNKKKASKKKSKSKTRK